MSDDKPKRRWRFRFSLLTLLVAMTLAAIGLFLLDVKPKQKAGGYQYTGFILDLFNHAVNRVEPNSPAADAGMKPGDLILAVDGVDIIDNVSLWYAFANRYEGEVVNVVVLRGDKKITLKMSVEVNYALKRIGEGR